MKKYDFGGYATKNDLRCTDGRTIRHGAFKDCDGATVPLVWQHMHDSPDNVLGHATLENRDDGVYAYCTFNKSPYGVQAKELVKHGDISSLSIYANQLKQRGADVVHGMIREVSLVLSGANPGALIDNLSFSHSDGSYETFDDEALIYFSDPLSLSHIDDEEEKEYIDEDGNEVEVEPLDEEDDMDEEEYKKIEHADDSDEETIQDVFETLSEKQKNAVYAIIGAALENEGAEVSHADDSGEESVADGEETIQEVFDTLSEKQKTAVYAIIGAALENEGEMAQSDIYDEEGLVMKHNAFDTEYDETAVLTHAEMDAIFADAKRMGSLKDAVLEHGITNIEALFPEAQAVNREPELISRPMEWVSKVLGAVHKSPFSKVKSTAANITAEQARAKGYVKGTQKVEEVITALNRVVDATTIYKLQKLDRDDIIDITDFDVVSFLKSEMRVMLEEEIARAILVGDGRTPTAPDKIKEDKIIPVWSDEETYTTHQVIDSSLTGSAKAKAFIEAAIRARKYYKGSGQPTLYVGTDLLTEMRLIRDDMGHRLYKNDQELADEMRVSAIVEIELLDGLVRETKATEPQPGVIREFGGLIVNLSDYNAGSNKGGEVTMFDDFDLDFNKYEYLIETRMSGALTKPMSALALEFGEVSNGGE